MPAASARGVPRRHEAPRRPVADDLPEADVVGAHDGGAAGHRLQEHHPERGQRARARRTRWPRGRAAAAPCRAARATRPGRPPRGPSPAGGTSGAAARRPPPGARSRGPRRPGCAPRRACVSRALRGSKRPTKRMRGGPSGRALRGGQGAVEVGVDPVGDDLEVLLGEVGPHRGDAGLRDRDQAVGAGQRAPHVGQEVAVAPVAALEVGVEGAHVHRGQGGAQRVQGERGHREALGVHHVHALQRAGHADLQARHPDAAPARPSRSRRSGIEAAIRSVR